MTAFRFNEDKSIKYNIIGDFRSGTDFESFKLLIDSVLLSGSEISFDLNRVTFMDSDTMAFIEEHSIESHITWNQKSYVYKRYIDYLQCSNLIESRPDLQAKLNRINGEYDE